MYCLNVKNKGIWQYVVAHVCKTAFGRLRQKGHEFEASLDYRLRLCLQKKQSKGEKYLKERKIMKTRNNAHGSCVL